MDIEKNIANKVVSIDAIKPHKRNYRQHPESQISQLGASHSRFGQFRSCVLWERPNGEYITVAGHGIIEAMKRNGVTSIRADVLPSSTPQEEIDAILIADNLHAQSAQDDTELLVSLLQEQRDAGLDLASLGTDEESLRQMLESLGDGYLDEDDKGRTTELNEPEGGDVESAHNVLVECENEAEQQRAYEMLTEEGFKCKVLTL